MVSTTNMRTWMIAAAMALGACSGGDEDKAGPPPATPVKVAAVQTQSVPNIIELPGRVEPIRTAEVRARVTGIVQARVYDEGTEIRKGAPLFRIDPREVQATVNQARANLQRLQATAANASAVVQRYQPLVSEQAISQQEYDAAVAAQREARAQVAAARAQLDAAQLQLSYTTVRAPISGRVGRALVTEGALVSQSEGTLMTRIEQLNPIFVTLTQASSEVLDIRRAIASGELELDPNGRIEFEVQFEDGTPYPIKGRLNFLDYSVDQSTGAVVLRGEIPNPQQLLLPGDFVRARILAGQREGGIIVPQRAVQVGENGSTVFVVGPDGKARSQNVELGSLVDNGWIIKSGLKPGDKVIVSNLQKIRPGAPVKVQDSRSVLGSTARPQPSGGQPSGAAGKTQ